MLLYYGSWGTIEGNIFKLITPPVIPEVVKNNECNVNIQIGKYKVRKNEK